MEDRGQQQQKEDEDEEAIYSAVLGSGAYKIVFYVFQEPAFKGFFNRNKVQKEKQEINYKKDKQKKEINKSENNKNFESKEVKNENKILENKACKIKQEKYSQIDNSIEKQKISITEEIIIKESYQKKENQIRNDSSNSPKDKQPKLDNTEINQQQLKLDNNMKDNCYKILDKNLTESKTPLMKRDSEEFTIVSKDKKVKLKVSSDCFHANNKTQDPHEPSQSLQNQIDTYSQFPQKIQQPTQQEKSIQDKGNFIYTEEQKSSLNLKRNNADKGSSTQGSNIDFKILCRPKNESQKKLQLNNTESVKLINSEPFLPQDVIIQLDQQQTIYRQYNLRKQVILLLNIKIKSIYSLQ